MLFKKDSPVGATEVERRQGENVLYVNYISYPGIPSIAENPEVMERVLNELTENPNISRIIFVQQRNYNYSAEQVFLLFVREDSVSNKRCGEDHNNSGGKYREAS